MAITDPNDLTGVDVWIDSSDASTLYIDAGTTNVSSDMDLVQEWHDKSGNDNDFTQTAPLNRPVYRTSLINSLDTVEFVSVSSTYMTGTKPASWAQDMDFTFCMGYKATNASTRQIIVSGYNSGGGNTGGFYIDWRGDTNIIELEIFESGSWKMANFKTGPLDTDFHIYAFTVSGTEVTMYMDGQQVNTITLTSGLDMSFDTNDFEIGRNTQGGGIEADGYITELVMFDNALDSFDLIDLMSYMWTRWTGDEALPQQPWTLNGSNQYATCADSADWDFGTNDFGISYWVDLHSLPANAWGGFVGQRIAFNNDLSWNIEYRTNGGVNQWQMEFNNGSFATQIWSHTPTLNTLYHLFFRRQGNNLDLFIDGVKQATKDVTGLNINTSSQVLTIGAEQTGVGTWGSFLDGSMSNLIIWNNPTLPINDDIVGLIYDSGVQRQPWELNKLIDPNPVLALPLNTGIANGNRYFDVSGNDNHATPIASPTFDGAIRPYKYNPLVVTGFAFDGGATKYINIPNNDSLNPTKAISFGGWVFCDASPANAFGRLIDKFSTGQGSYGSYWTTSTDRIDAFITYDGTNAQVLTSSVLQRSKWYHWLYTWDGTTANLYINGKLDQTASTSGTINVGTTPVSIGRSTEFSNEEFTGTQMKCRIWGKALTSAEAENEFNKTPKDENKDHPASYGALRLDLAMDSKDSTLTDRSGLGNDGTANGGITSDGQVFNLDSTKPRAVVNPLLLNGSNQNGQASQDLAVYDLGTNDFHASCRVKFITFPSIGGLDDIFRIFGEGEGVTGTGPRKQGWGLAYNATTQNFEWTTYDGVTLTQRLYNFAVTLGEEYQVTVERGGNDLFLHINGTQVGASQSVTGVSYDRQEANGIFIGSYVYGGGPTTSYINADVSEVYIASSSGHVEERYNDGVSIQPWQLSFADDLIGAWPLNTGVADGRRFEDHSGNENDMVFANAPTFTGDDIEIIDEVQVNAFAGDGSTKWVNVLHDASFNSNTFAAGAWFKLNSLGSNQVIMAREDFNANSTQAWRLEVNSSNQIYGMARRTAGGGDFEEIFGATVVANRWYFAVLTCDGVDLKLYLDAVEQGSQGLTSILSVSEDISIFAHTLSASPQRFLDGYIAAPFFYVKGLDLAGVQKSYARNLPRLFRGLESDEKTDLLMYLNMSAHDKTLIDLSGNGNDGIPNGGIGP